MKIRSAAAARNAAPIADVLRDWLPPQGTVLEVASGGGEHALSFARRFPGLDWQPSDPDAGALASIASWREEGPSNLLEPLRIDVRDADWGIAAADVLLSINMVHISPWSASIGLMDGAARLLPAGGALILYGPWLVEGEPTAPSNLEFDASLRERNLQWGIRQLGRFSAEAAARGLVLEDRRAMPANNRMLLFKRS